MMVISVAVDMGVNQPLVPMEMGVFFPDDQKDACGHEAGGRGHRPPNDFF